METQFTHVKGQGLTPGSASSQWDVGSVVCQTSLSSLQHENDDKVSPLLQHLDCCPNQITTLYIPAFLLSHLRRCCTRQAKNYITVGHRWGVCGIIGHSGILCLGDSETMDTFSQILICCIHSSSLFPGPSPGRSVWKSKPSLSSFQVERGIVLMES